MKAMILLIGLLVLSGCLEPQTEIKEPEITEEPDMNMEEKKVKYLKDCDEAEPNEICNRNIDYNFDFTVELPVFDIEDIKNASKYVEENCVCGEQKETNLSPQELIDTNNSTVYIIPSKWKFIGENLCYYDEDLNLNGVKGNWLCPV